MVVVVAESRINERSYRLRNRICDRFVVLAADYNSVEQERANRIDPIRSLARQASRSGVAVAVTIVEIIACFTGSRGCSTN